MKVFVCHVKEKALFVDIFIYLFVYMCSCLFSLFIHAFACLLTCLLRLPLSLKSAWLGAHALRCDWPQPARRGEERGPESGLEL